MYARAEITGHGVREVAPPGCRINANLLVPVV